MTGLLEDQKLMNIVLLVKWLKTLKNYIEQKEKIFLQVMFLMIK